MDRYSVSFTLGKPSVPHGGNLAHNNREFTAANIHAQRSAQNITYTSQDIRQAYHQLFDEAVKEYNDKQYRRDRVITDYYERVASGKREEPFYEIVVQFGDSLTAPCGSERGEIARQMLDEYMRGFIQRNPNLHVINAVLHMDEASPHLHIDFVPFYTQGRKNGLQKGVSMKAALVEQGFAPRSTSENQLVLWEAAERAEMERILRRRGYAREDKNAHYAHMSVEEFKHSQDMRKIQTALREQKTVSVQDTQAENVRKLKSRVQSLEHETEQLRREKQSPYKSFFYSSPEKQAFVMERLDALHIPYRETENGFEAQECFVDTIRKLEKEFKAPRSSARDTLRQDIDRAIMQAKDFDDLLERLRRMGYLIKQGKYIAVKPKGSANYIRLKSLGEFYSEQALRNRLASSKKFQKTIADTISEAKKKSAPNLVVLETIQFYTVSFSTGALPMRKKNAAKPFSWTNDAELDVLLSLNRKIRDGASLGSLRHDFEQLVKAAEEKADALQKAEHDLEFALELKEKILIVFEGKQSKAFTREQAEETLRGFPSITRANYRNIDVMIADRTEKVRRASQENDEVQKTLTESSAVLSAAEKVFGETYVQSLVAEERQRREAAYIPNGMKNAGTGGITN